MNILFLGDVVGKPGRRALASHLEKLRAEHNPDFVIANGENLAHNRGATLKTIREIIKSGVDLITSGNHWADQPEMLEALKDRQLPHIRPANVGDNQPGDGYRLINVRTQKILVINLLGRVFMNDKTENPFKKIDQILKETASDKPDVILLDIHAEATSEKNALGLYLNGRVTAVLGTHTHVPTDDAIVMDKGTGYVTDVGMVGPLHSVLGLDAQEIINHFLSDTPFKTEVAETDKVCINYAVIHTAENNKNDQGVDMCGSLTRHTDIIDV